MGLSHDSENPDEGYIVLFGILVWSHTFTRDSDSISMRRLDNGDDK